MFAENAIGLYPRAEDGKFYSWRPAGHSIWIRLSLEVVDAIDSLIESASAGPDGAARPDREIGGLLLGHAETHPVLDISIEAFEPVACSSANGEWTPGGAEQIALKRRISRHALSDRDLQVVGFYRTHARQGLALTAEDCALRGSCFSGTHNVVLLIKPSPRRVPTAGFFFWDESGLTQPSSHLEFPFDAAALNARAPGPVAVPAPAVALKELEPPLFQALAPARPWRKYGAGGAAAAGVAALALFAHPYRSAPLPVATPVTPALGFTAAENADMVSLRWDRRSPIIAAARRATLSIENGAYDRTIELAPDQLRSGSVLYGRLPDSAEIRLEVFADQKTSVSEVLRLGGTAPPEPVLTAATPAAPQVVRKARAKRHRRRHVRA